eukprot:6207898-Pleurochrysis_carterae.AAC.1
MQRDRQSEISIASERSEDEECRPQSVQVAVRVRPMNDREMKSNTTPVVNASSEKGEVTLVRGMTGQRHVRQTYNFDSVFTSFSSQEEVFETVRPLVNEVMCGYEATVRWVHVHTVERPRALSTCAEAYCTHLQTMGCRCLLTARRALARRTPWKATSSLRSRRASFHALSRCVHSSKHAEATQQLGPCDACTLHAPIKCACDVLSVGVDVPSALAVLVCRQSSSG